MRFTLIFKRKKNRRIYERVQGPLFMNITLYKDGVKCVNIDYRQSLSLNVVGGYCC